MKLNLRKASALQLAINEQIATVEMPVSVTLGRYDSPAALVGKAENVFLEGLLKKRALLSVLYSIREKTGAASERAGVARLLTENEKIKKVIVLLTPLAAIREYAKTANQLEAAVNDLRNETTQQSQYPYQKRESFTSSIITEGQTQMWQKEIADLKRQQQLFSDALLEANVRHEIELSSSEEEVLKKYSLL